MENRFTKSLQQAVQVAQEQALNYGSGEVGTEHLLIGIAAQTQSIGAKVLAEVGLTQEKLQEMLILIDI